MDDKILAPVSVIVPCYRCGATIERAVASIANQTLRPAQVILVDDCSDDGTLEVLSSLARKYPDGWIEVISLKQNGGAAQARNVGWAAAQQRFISFLDADDSWHPQKLEVQTQWMLEHPDVMLTGHASEVISEALVQKTLSVPFAPPKVVAPGSLLRSNRFATSGVMLHSHVPFRFDARKRRGEDYLLWLQIGLSGAPMFWFAEVLSYSYKAKFGAGGLSGNLLLMQLGEIDAFRQLVKAGLLSYRSYPAVAMFSWMKYFRRVAKTYLFRDN